MQSGKRPVALLLAERLLGFFARLWTTLASIFGFASQLVGAFFPQRQKKRKLRPWMIVRQAKAGAHHRQLSASEADIRRVLERLKNLHDVEGLSDRAVGFAGQGSDFFARPEEVAAIVEALIRENPPFLHIAREAPSEAEGQEGGLQTELIEKEIEVTITEPETLFIPRAGVEHLEHRRPPGYPLLRTARSLADLRAAPLLYQAMPEDYTIARLVEGAIPVLAYREDRRYLLFEQEDRVIQRTEKRKTRVPVEIETGGRGHHERLCYLLLDRSTSLVRNCSPRGTNAVMELAIAVAMIRCDLGRPHARYYYRSFAERLDPGPNSAPFQAASVQEKDELAGRVMRTNFSGEATNVVEALETAMDDIERMIAEGIHTPAVKPRIALLTDGRATIYRNTGARLKRLGIGLDTVLIGREAANNPELMRISDTITMVDPTLYRGAA